MGCTVEGKIKTKIRDLLKQQGITVDSFWEQRGDYRKATWDLARWGGFGYKNGLRISFHSWDTMTQCARYGIVIGKRSGVDHELHAKEESSAAITHVRDLQDARIDLDRD